LPRHLAKILQTGNEWGTGKPVTKILGETHIFYTRGVAKKRNKKSLYHFYTILG